MRGRLREWMADRFAWEPIRKAALDRRVAKGKWYYGDGAALTLLLGVMIATGVVMVFTYSPTPDTAYRSVVYLTERQVMGGFVRALHYWSAGLMVVMVFFHLSRQILVAGYKFPREGTWLVGVVLLFLVLAMSFTGYVLRWDERGIHAARVMLHMFSNVPWIGGDLVVLVQGGEEPGSLLLTRIYALHVLVLPASIVALVGIHLYLVLAHGITSVRERRELVRTVEEQRRLYDEQKNSEEYGETFHPETTAKSGAMAFVVFAVALALAAFAGPAKLYPSANLVEPGMPMEEWWFWWYSGLIALLPPWLAPWFVILFPLAVLVALVALPFLDRGPRRGMRKRPVAVGVVVVGVVGLVVLTALRRDSAWTGWPSSEPPPVPADIKLSEQAELGRQMVGKFGCMTCHSVAGHGRQVAVDLAAIDRPMSREDYREYILKPPEGIAMPAYEGRMSEAELKAVIDFVHAAQAFPFGKRVEGP